MKQCPQCGEVITDQTRIYCDNCGFDLSDSEEHRLIEEKHFIEGYSRNYPYIWFSCIAICIILIVASGLYQALSRTLSFILFAVGIMFGSVLPILLTYSLKKSKENYGVKKDKK